MDVTKTLSSDVCSIYAADYSNVSNQKKIIKVFIKKQKHLVLFRTTSFNYYDEILRPLLNNYIILSLGAKRKY